MIIKFIDMNAINQFKYIIKDQLKDISRYKVYNKYTVQYKDKVIYTKIYIASFYS